MGWVTPFHLSQLSPGVSESKENIRKTQWLWSSPLLGKVLNKTSNKNPNKTDFSTNCPREFSGRLKCLFQPKRVYDCMISYSCRPQAGNTLYLCSACFELLKQLLWEHFGIASFYRLIMRICTEYYRQQYWHSLSWQVWYFRLPSPSFCPKCLLGGGAGHGTTLRMRFLGEVQAQRESCTEG